MGNGTDGGGAAFNARPSLVSLMADSNSGGSGGTTAIVAIVALVLVGILVWFFFLRGGAAPAGDGGADIDINVENPLPDGQ